MNKKYLLAVPALLVFTIAGCTNKQTPAEIQNEAFADIKAEIQADVDNPERAAQAILIIEQLDDEFDATRENLIASKERMWELNRDYHASREAFDREMAVYVAELRANQRAVMDLRAQLAQLFTDEEWAAASKARSKALTAAIESLKNI